MKKIPIKPQRRNYMYTKSNVYPLDTHCCACNNCIKADAASYPYYKIWDYTVHHKFMCNLHLLIEQNNVNENDH